MQAGHLHAVQCGTPLTPCSADAAHVLRALQPRALVPPCRRCGFAAPPRMLRSRRVTAAPVPSNPSHSIWPE